MSEDHVYKDGDIVWVKLGNNWWPGEVTGVHRQPEGLVQNLKKKPYCVVKFFQEDAYEYIKNPKQIFPFQCSKKEEFIKKGTALYNAKNKFMEKFPSDVETAERLTRKTVQTTDLIIINDRPDSIVKAILGPTYTRCSNDYYDNNTSTATDYNNKRRSGDSVTKILNITPQRTTLETTIRTPDAAKTLLSPIIIPSKPALATTPDANFYRCNLCNFSSQRQNVMILHRRTHSNATGGGTSAVGGGVSTFVATPLRTTKTAPATITAASTPKASTNAIDIAAKTTTPATATTKNGSNKSAAISIDNNNAARGTKLDKHKATTHLNSRSKHGLSSGGVATGAADAVTVSSLQHKLRSSLRIDADVKEITMPDRVPPATIAKDGLDMSMDYDTTDNSISAESSMQTAKLRASSPRKHNLEGADDVDANAAQARSAAEEIRLRLLADWSDGEKDDEMTDADAEPTTAQSQNVVVRRLSTGQPTTANQQQDNMATPSNTAGISNNGPHTSKQNRIRNIPKKDRRDAVLKEFISDYVPTTTPNAATPMDNSLSYNSSSSSIDSVVVVAVVPPNSGETIILDDTENDEVPSAAGGLGVNGESEEIKPTISSEAAEMIIKTDILDNHKVEVDIEAELQRAMQLEDGIETKIEPEIDTYTPKLRLKRGRRNVEVSVANERKSNYVSTCQLVENDGDQNDSNVENKPHHIAPVAEEIKTEELSETPTQPKGRQKRPQRSSRRQRNGREIANNTLPETITTKVENEPPSVVAPLDDAPQVLPLSPQHIKEEEEAPQTSAAVAVPLPPQHRLLTDCFDFQEDDSCNDTLKSIADFKKKYLSPDKVQERAAQANNGILQEPESVRKRSTEQKDQQLAHDIEMLLEQTADTIPAVVARTHSYGGSSKEDLLVKGLPIKERGKRIFKSRNRARVTTDDASSSTMCTTVGLVSAAAAPETIVKENAGMVAEQNVQREEQQIFEESAHAINSEKGHERDIELAQVEQQSPQAVELIDNQIVAVGSSEVENEFERNEESMQLYVQSACNEELRLSAKIVNNGLLATPAAMDVAPSYDSVEQNLREYFEVSSGASDVAGKESNENNLENTVRDVEIVEKNKENELESTMQVGENIEEENNSKALANQYGNEERSEIVSIQPVAKDVQGETEHIDMEPKNIEIEREREQEIEIEIRTQEEFSDRVDTEREEELTDKEPEDIGRENKDVERETEDIGKELEAMETEPDDTEIEQESIERRPDDSEKEPEYIKSRSEDIDLEPKEVEEEPEKPQEIEHEFRAQEELGERMDIEIEQDDNERETDNIERELDDVERDLKDTEIESKDIERSPVVIERELENIERETEYTDREPDAIEIEPNDIDREPDAIDNEPDDIPGEPDTYTERNDIEPELDDIEPEGIDIPEVIAREPDATDREPDDIQGGPDTYTDRNGIEPGLDDMEPERIEIPEVMETEPDDIERDAEEIQKEPDTYREQEDIEKEFADIEQDCSERPSVSQQESGEEICSMQTGAEFNTTNRYEEPEEEAVDNEIEKINKARCTLVADVENETDASHHESPAELPAEFSHETQETLEAAALPADTMLNNEYVADEQQEIPPSRITSPTDDNSSVCTSEAGAEFGSPTSMLDDERLPAMTGRLMTPIEGMLEPIAADRSRVKKVIAEQLVVGIDEHEENTNGESNYVPTFFEGERAAGVEEGAEEKVAEEPMECVNENEKERNAEQAVDDTPQEEERMDGTDCDRAVQPLEDDTEKKGQATEVVAGGEKIAKDLFEIEDEHREKATLEQPLEHLDQAEREHVFEQPEECENEGEREIKPELASEDVETNNEDMENWGTMQNSAGETHISEENEQSNEMNDEGAAIDDVVATDGERPEETPEENNKNVQIEDNEKNSEPDAGEAEVRYSSDKLGEETEIRNQEEFINQDEDLQKQDGETGIRNNAEGLGEQAETQNETKTEEEEIRNEKEACGASTEMHNQSELVGEEEEIQSHAEIVDEEAKPQNQAQIVGEEAEMHDEGETITKETVEPILAKCETGQNEFEDESEGHTEGMESEQTFEDVGRLNNGQEQEAMEAANTAPANAELLGNEEYNSAHIEHTEPDDSASDDDNIESPPHEPLSGHEGDAGTTTVTRTQKRRTIAERNKNNETPDNENEARDGAGSCTPTGTASESLSDFSEDNKDGSRRRTTRQHAITHEATTEEESVEKQIKQLQRTTRLNPRKSTKPKKSTEKLNEVELAYVLSAEHLVASDVSALPAAQELQENAQTMHQVTTPNAHLIGTSPQQQNLELTAGAYCEETVAAIRIKTGSSRKRRGAMKITPRRNASDIQMTIDARKRNYINELDDVEQKSKSRKIEESNLADACVGETTPATNEVTNTATELTHGVLDHSSSSGSYIETPEQSQSMAEKSEHHQPERNANSSIQPQLQLPTNTETNSLNHDNERITSEQELQYNEELAMQQQPIETADYTDGATTPAATAETAAMEGDAGEEEEPLDESNAEDLVAYSPIENQQSMEDVVQQEELLVDAGNIVEAGADNESNIDTQGVGVTLYPQFGSSADSQYKPDNTAINVSPMEKVRINVDVANPLSTQIANILGTKSGAGASSTTAKRKSNLEEAIPSYVIERPGQSQQSQQQHTTSTLDFTGEQSAVAHVQQMCPNVEITRKEKLIEVPAEASVTQQQESIANSSNAMFDISNMPIVLGNEHFMSAQGDMQIVLTSSAETEQHLRTDGQQQILQQQIFQSPYRSPQQQQNVQQRQRKSSTNQQPQQLTQQQQQQPGLIIIKAAPGDLIIQQTQPQTIVGGTVQQMAPQIAADANAKYNLGSGVTLLPIAEPKQKQQQRQQQEKLQQQQQQQAVAKKPKSPAAAATGGRKQIGNTITLPSSITVKQRQRKLSDALASAPAAPSIPQAPSEPQPSSSKSASVDSKVQKRLHSTSSRRTQMQAQTQKVQQRRLTATYTNLMELQQQEQRRSEARAQLQRRLSYSEVYTPPPAKIFRNTFMAGPIFDIHSQQIFAATAEQQLLQLQQQQQQRQMLESPTTSTQPPPLHPLPNRKSRHTLRRLSAKPEMTPPPSAQNEIQEEQQQQQQLLQQQQLQPTQFVLLSQPQHLTLVEPQLHQEQQVTEVHMPTELVAPPLSSEIIPAEYEAIDLQEPAPQVYTEEILAEAFEANELPPSSVMAVPSQPVPGYPDTLLLCRRVDDEWLPVVAQPYYFTHSDQQLRPIPKEVLIGHPILTPNAGKTTETPANDSYKGETGVTILIGNEYVHMEWDQFLEVMRCNDDLFDLRDDQGRIFQLNRDALLTLQNDADLQDKYRQLQQLLEEQQMEEQQQLEQQQLLQQHLMQQLQTVTVSAEDGMETDVIPFLQIDTSQTLQLINTEDGSLILQPTLAQPPLSPPCTRPALTNATNALLNQTPIMSPLEKPSTAAAATATLLTDSTGQHLTHLTTAAAPEHLAAAGFITADVANTLAVARPTLGDSLAVIGVVPTQPTLLPTTITNPAIAPPKTDLIPDMTTAAQMHAQYRHAQRAIYNDPGS